MLPAVLLLGCGTIDPEAPPGNPTVTIAPETPSAKAPIRDARRFNEDARRHSDAARSELETARERITVYRDTDYRELQDLVTRMREKASATTEELEELYERVFAAEGRIQALLDRIKKVTEELAAERELRAQADLALVEARGRIAAKEVTEKQLRQQFADMKATADTFEQNAQRNHQAALTAAGDRERMQGQRDLIAKVLGVTILLLLASLVANYLQFKSRSLLPI